MSNKPFHYQAPFPLKKDDTEYYLLTSEHVSVSEFEGQEILKVAPEALTLLARQAFHDASFMLRPAHQQQVADILRDPEASENDKYVALQFLRNSDIAAKGVLPTCQDTGTAIIVGKKGQRVWTGGGDEAALARGVKLTGATVHYVNEIPDGGEIIMQKAVAVRRNDTPETLQQRVMRMAEWKIYPPSVERVCLHILQETGRTDRTNEGEQSDERI